MPYDVNPKQYPIINNYDIPDKCLEIGGSLDTVKSYLKDILDALLAKRISVAHRLEEQLDEGLVGSLKEAGSNSFVTEQEASFIKNEVSNLINSYIKEEVITSPEELEKRTEEFETQVPELAGMLKPSDIRPGGLGAIMTVSNLDKIVDTMKYTKVSECYCQNKYPKLMYNGRK